MIIYCPHCNAETDVPQHMLIDCESYGTNTYSFKCNVCEKGILIFLRRQVVCTSVDKTNHITNQSMIG